MTVEVHALVQDAQDFHVALPAAPKEDHVPVAGTGNQAWTQISAIFAERGCSRQRRKSLVKLGQVADRLIHATLFQRIGPDTVKVTLGLKRQTELPHQLRA